MGVGSIAAGLALLAFTWVCWNGRLRGWVEAPAPFPNSLIITAAPGLGILLSGFGLGTLLSSGLGDALGVIGLLVGVALCTVPIWEPDWYGPRWYREYKRAFEAGMPGGLAAMPDDARRAGESSVQATERHMASSRPSPPGSRVRLVSESSGTVGGVGGRRSTLIYFPQAPVFAVRGSMTKPEMIEVIPAESLQGVQQLPAGAGTDGTVRRAGWRSWLLRRVRVDTTEGVWLFESWRARRTARHIRWRYLDDSRDMYGLPLREDKNGASSRDSEHGRTTAGE